MKRILLIKNLYAKLQNKYKGKNKGKEMKHLLAPFKKGSLSLKNSMVMAPMTRSRAIDNIPNDLMVEYYSQRSGAGLIITEGTSPSANGLGYCRIPAIFSQAQIEGWEKITTAVHKNDSKIFIQLMHTGRISHQANLPEGAKVVGVSNIKAGGQMYTDKLGLQDHTEPTALTTDEVYQLMEEFVVASKNAVKAGFDGIELHNANGYLLEQFLNPNVNNRTDEFGGSVLNRTKFIIELVTKIAAEIGKDKIGIRFSPFSDFNDMGAYNEDEVNETYIHLAKELNKIGIAYIHIGLNPAIPQKTLEGIHSNFSNTFILCNGLTAESGEELLKNGSADLVAFGRFFIANPDFDQRLEKDSPLNELDFNSLYTPDSKGYTDYPFLTKN